MEGKHIIWTNNPFELTDFENDLKEQYPDADETELYWMMNELNNQYLEDEKLNLEKPLDNNLVMFGELSLWDGTKTGYKVLKSSNLNGIFDGTCGDYITWYVDEGEIKCEDTHHDGTNRYIYRVLKKQYDKWEFEDYCYDNGIKKAVELMTEPLGHYVAEIYGWEKESA